MSARRKNARRFRGVQVPAADGTVLSLTFELRKGDGLWFCAPDKCWLKCDVGPAVEAAMALHAARRAQQPEDPRQLKMF